MTQQDERELLELRKRAEAAERTVEVLKRKVLALYDGSSKVAIQHQLEHIRRRSEAIQRRRELSELRTAELERYNNLLEAQVAERTRTIRTILDNVAFGFLLVGPDLVVAEGHSKSCFELLGTDQIAGRGLCEVLCLGRRDEGGMILTIEQVFDDLMLEELSLAQIPCRFRVGDKTLALAYRVVRDQRGAPVQVLVTVSDATELDAAEREAQQNRMVVGIFKRRDAFRAFVSDSLAQLQAAKSSVAEQHIVRRIVHTLKGNAACYDVLELVEAAHRAEDARTIDEPALSQLEAEFQAFLRKHRDLIGIELENGFVFEVPEDKARELRQMVDRPSIAPPIKRWAAELSLKPMSDLIGPVRAMVERLAERMSKRVRFETQGEAVLVDAVAFRSIVSALTHLLRNAVAHGIEPSAARGTKPAFGRIALRTLETEEDWQVEVYDDGAGIDVDAVVASAIELGQLTRERADALDTASKLELICLDGLSTATEVTNIAGRGVGLSAVRSVVQCAGGCLRVATERGAFTSITLVLPKPAVLRRRNALSAAE